MKVGIILPHTQAFGGVRRFLEVARELTRRGHEVTIHAKENNGTRWYDPAYEFRIVGWGNYDEDVHLIGDPPSFSQLKHVTNPYVWVIAGGKYLDMYQALYKSDVRLAHKFMINNRVFFPYFPIARYCEGGVNTAFFDRDPAKKLRVGFYAGRGAAKGEAQIVAALKPVQHVELVPISGLEHKELRDVYRSLDYFVAWEQRPGWSNTAAEALACGIPVVTNGNNVEPFRDRCIVVSDLYQYFMGPMHDFSWIKTVDRLEEIWKEDGLI